MDANQEYQTGMSINCSLIADICARIENGLTYPDELYALAGYNDIEPSQIDELIKQKELYAFRRNSAIGAYVQVYKLIPGEQFIFQWATVPDQSLAFRMLCSQKIKFFTKCFESSKGEFFRTSPSFHAAEPATDQVISNTSNCCDECKSKMESFSASPENPKPEKDAWTKLVKAITDYLYELYPTKK